VTLRAVAFLSVDFNGDRLTSMLSYTVVVAEVVSDLH